MSSRFHPSHTRFIVAIVVLMTLVFVSNNHAVTVCTLKDPDRDIRGFFPEATNYKTNSVLVANAGGDALLKEIEARLGDKLDPIYEGKDVEHTTYTVLKGTETIGYVSGVNQKSEFGNLQVFTATDTEGKIREVKYQRIVSPHAKVLNAKEFTETFKGLALSDFYLKTPAVEKLKAPAPKTEKDFLATVRGIKKNLIYFDIFVLDRKHDAAYTKATAAEGEGK